MSQVTRVIVCLTGAALLGGALAGCSVGPLPGAPIAAPAGVQTTPPAGPGQPSPRPTPAPTRALSLATGRLVGVPKSCPPTAAMSAFFPAELQTETVDPGPQTLECIYKSGTVDHVLAVVFRVAPAGTTVDDLKAEIDKAATDPTDHTGAITGLGQAAYYYSNSEEAGLLVLNGGVTFSVVDGYDVTSLEQIARSVLTE